MSFLKPPETEYVDHYERSKFNLIWNFSIALIFLLTVFSVANYSNRDYPVYPNVIAIVLAFITLAILKITRKYRGVAIFIVVSAFLLLSSTYFLLDRVLHFNTPLWMILNSMLAFFILGRLWGIVLIIAHFSVLYVYFHFQLNINLSNIDPYNGQDTINFMIENSIVLSGIVYLLLQFIKTNKTAELEIKKSNEVLTEQNTIISTQNQEKEIMMKEIHHRVKNNLQVVTSLLRLQSGELKDAEHQESFNEAINRVKAMALIHEKMYRSDMLSNFDLESYLRSLANDLIETYAIDKPIELKIDAEIEQLDPKNIVSLSLLFNELISNSVKHAFSNQSSGEIVVECHHESKDHYCSLRYSDNGRWLEPVEKSFGLELIDAMVEQLEGSHSLNRDTDGTHYSFRLKILLES